MAALDIPSGAERHSLGHLGIHGVFFVFMGVDVLSELDEAMFGELNGLAGNHGLWAKHSRDAVLVREAVDPERHGMNKIVHKGTWDASVYLYQFRVH